MSLGALIGEIVFRAIFPIGLLIMLFLVDPVSTDWDLSLVIVAAWVMAVGLIAFVKTIRSRLPRLRSNERFVAFSVFYELASMVAVVVCCYAVLYKRFGLLEGEKPVKDAADFLYFSIVTWTTLGYGDIHPATASKLLAASEALFGYVFMGLYLALSFYAISSRTEGRGGLT